MNVDAPLVRVAWGLSSHYARQWQTKADSLLWMLEHHPELARCRPGAARVYAQLSFAHACLRQRGAACRWAWRGRSASCCRTVPTRHGTHWPHDSSRKNAAMRSNWHERRVPFALAVASGVVPGEVVLRHLNARGHGI